jgi:hypothetical protein
VTWSLWLLIGLQVWGWLRFLLRGLRTVKGAALAVLGVLVFLPWLGSLLLATPSTHVDHSALLRAGPGLLLGYCFLNLLLTASDAGLYFSPAEVGFLFPAPLSRRQLLAYKVITTALVGLPTTLLFTLLFRSQGGWFLSSFVGLALLYLFIQLFNMAVQLLVTAVGARLVRRGRLVLLVLGALAIFAWLFQAEAWLPSVDWAKALTELEDSPVWQAITLPFRWFIEAYLAEYFWPDLAYWGGLALLVDAVMLTLVFDLDAQYLEASAAASSRAYIRLQRLRGREVSEGLAQGKRVRFTLPIPPRLGGIGPVLWRQLLNGLRNPARLVILAIPLAVLLIGPLTATGKEEAESRHMLPILAGGVIWVTVFFTTVIPFDFRGDVDRIAVLKTFPLPSWRLAIGQIAAPVVLMTAYQWGLLIALGALLRNPDPVLLIAAVLAGPFNLLLFTLENLLFLLFPMRLMGATPGDFQALGRSVVLLFARLFVLFAALAAAGGASVIVYLLTRGNMIAVVATTGCFVTAEGVVLIPLVALAFDHFDVGRDTPP